MREFVKIDGYKINILKLMAFIYADNSKLEKYKKKSHLQ